MRLDCPIRGFCNKFTKSIMASGVLLLLTGLLFCNYNSVFEHRACEAPKAQATTEEPNIQHNTQKNQCTETTCKRKIKKKKNHPSIRVQQRQMKERLSRINQKIEKLKDKRERLNNVTR
tara:strand:+ start:4036 stop:4392 length:357 start_codon:yes stop_codon:yes gene_type:complete